MCGYAEISGIYPLDLFLCQQLHKDFPFNYGDA